MRTKISQAEARRMKERLEAIESWAKRKTWDWRTGEPFNSVSIGRVEGTPLAVKACEVARLLNHAVIAVPREGNVIEFFAIRADSKP